MNFNKNFNIKDQSRTEQIAEIAEKQRQQQRNKINEKTNSHCTGESKF